MVPLPVVPALFDPVLADPELAGPLFVPPEAVPVGLVLVPPEPGELDVGVAGVEEPPPGADEDSVALGLAVLDGGAVDGGQRVPVGSGDALRLALLLAFAEAVEVAVLVAVPFAVPVVVAVLVAVVVPPGLVPPPTVPPPDPLLAGLLDALLTGVPLGVTDLAGLAATDEGEEHPAGSTLLEAAEAAPWPVPLAAEPICVPDPFALGTPLAVLELVIPTAEPSWTTAWRSGGIASATPMANTAHAAARAGRSSPSRQSRFCRG